MGYMVVFFFSCFLSLHTVLYCGHINLHFHQQCERVLSSHPLLNFLFVDFFFNDGLSDPYAVIPHCFHLHFSDDERY